MKTKLLSLRMWICIVAVAWAPSPALRAAESGAKAIGLSSLDRPDRQDNQTFPPGALNCEDAELSQVFKIYASLSGRTVVRPNALPAVKITIASETPLSRVETLQALDSVLAQNGVTMIPMGTKFVKAVPSAQALLEAVPLSDLPPDQLPESSTYVSYLVRLKHRRPGDVARALQPLSKMPNSILAIDNAGMLLLRDYSSNVRRMLQLIDKIEQVPLEPTPAAKPEKHTPKAEENP